MHFWYQAGLLPKPSNRQTIKLVSILSFPFLWMQCMRVYMARPPLIPYDSLVGRKPGTIEDLTDLLAEDWSQLGSMRDLGAGNKRFFREELEKTWGQKHLAVLDEEEAQKWLLGVSIRFQSVVALMAAP